ncbi:Asp-tRNA(Asn)/Glu-tRNA(Gln) amidotransferase subunit GatB [Dethiosulfovibrio sp. F2B]|uniref:Asp-tRNA(Asn)/Glu-tRNA(Gln) amidotransferase subunit GatB n=1 Tax=Dethiosulfovibrio faecalis TaxID=2720018 RepID=UPI001F3968AB|nr:Asp-tRNA(Asn)/Glu-tRNA(Gln) amidotransferase subunit GatB [Dethiosulfovibrio faecalis]MCF4150833.1 Asp-tRNA(Asn)/Glu-tRNA(Gln) amidotransferase subunit GatB [Dethiosulfovibrio faecalis]
MSLTFTTVIGLEIHVQLNTRTKLFCGCSTDYIGATPNTNICPLCTGQPGTLPVLNERVVELGVRAGLALGCTINRVTRFDRKNYFYPDLPKAYQISEFYVPLAEKGEVTVTGDDGKPYKVGITRLHLEEDAGKLVHGASDGRIVGSTQSFVDYNRSSVPLAEIVSEPDITSPRMAKEYVATLRQMVRYLGVSDGDMEKGSMRVDANISLKVSDGRWGNRVEVKNMNSLRALERALEFEIRRQGAILSDGGEIHQETRNWDDSAGETSSSRSKEESNDYRYFTEPDLPPLVLSDSYIEDIERDLPELPWEKKARYERDFDLPQDDISVLTEQKDLAEYFEACVKAGASPARASNWIRTEVLRVLNERGGHISEFSLSPAALVELLRMVEGKKLSTTAAKEVFDAMVSREISLKEAIDACGVTAGNLSGDGLASLVQSVLEANGDVVEVIRSCDDKKDKKRKFLQGQVMKEARGQADPREVAKILDIELPR